MKLKVMTYNIHSCIGTDRVSDCLRTAGMVAKENPDVAGLQEMPHKALVVKGEDVLSKIGQATGMNAFFGEAFQWKEDQGGGSYGVAGLTRFPTEIVDKIKLPTPDPKIEPRVALILRCQAEKEFYFVVTHFSYNGEFEGDEEYRKASAQLIVETLERKGYAPAVIVGDFNTDPTTITMDYVRTCCDLWNDADGNRTPTADTGKFGWLQIDMICSFPKGAFELQNFRVIDDVLVSDHRPVIAELLLK